MKWQHKDIKLSRNNMKGEKYTIEIIDNGLTGVDVKLKMPSGSFIEVKNMTLHEFKTGFSEDYSLCESIDVHLSKH